MAILETLLNIDKQSNDNQTAAIAAIEKYLAEQLNTNKPKLLLESEFQKDLSEIQSTKFSSLKGIPEIFSAAYGKKLENYSPFSPISDSKSDSGMSALPSSQPGLPYNKAPGGGKNLSSRFYFKW